MQRNRGQGKINLSTIILATFAVVIVILILASTLISLNLNKDNEKLSAVQESNTTLQRRLDTLAPNRITLPAGRFPLEANEKLLSKAYTQLMEFVYTGTNSDNPFNANKNTLIQYFSKDGYDRLKKETLLQDGNKVKSLSKELKTCEITFSNFNLKDKTVDLTIYSDYSLAKPSSNVREGISVITLTYDFNSLTVSNFDMRSTSVEKQEIF